MKALVSQLAGWVFAASLAGCASPQVYGDPKTPVAGTVLDTVVHTADAEELRYVVLQRLTDRYVGEQGIVVTPAETDAYIRQVRDAMQRDRARQLAERDALTRKLAAGGLSPAEEQATRRSLDQAERAIDALGPVREAAVEDAETRAAREQVAAAFIRQWKVNRALYRQYGGRIIFQQGGPEPLDAYRRFLEENRARGDFTIVNKSLETAFWRYYRTDSIHSFYVPGSKEEAQAFGTPPWERAAAD